MAKIAGEFGATDSVSRALTLEEAVDIAIWHAAPGDVVLLSPACTSWDMFRDYEERGDLFKTLVHAHYGAAK
jgi:UDP-N-acetylmuramoylalanine--D-glutamate ligase